jgi:hypothetical protein
VAIKTKTLLFVVFIVLALGFAYFYFNFNPSEYSLFPKCPFYSFTGFYCPGCGSQRAIHQLLHGNILKGLNHNFLIILLTFVLVYDAIAYLLNNYYKKSFKNLLHNPKTTNTILILVIVFWILRNIKIYPFTILAP